MARAGNSDRDRAAADVDGKRHMRTYVTQAAPAKHMHAQGRRRMGARSCWRACRPGKRQQGWAGGCARGYLNRTSAPRPHHRSARTFAYLGSAGNPLGFRGRGRA